MRGKLGWDRVIVPRINCNILWLGRAVILDLAIPGTGLSGLHCGEEIPFLAFVSLCLWWEGEIIAGQWQGGLSAGNLEAMLVHFRNLRIPRDNWCPFQVSPGSDDTPSHTGVSYVSAPRILSSNMFLSFKFCPPPLTFLCFLCSQGNNSIPTHVPLFIILNAGLKLITGRSAQLAAWLLFF